MIEFKEISITGLFRKFDVTLPIKNNRIIIVGHNGIGKSTILNAFYYTISAQWEKLGEIQFETLKIRADRRVFTVKSEWLHDMKPIPSRRRRERTRQREFLDGESHLMSKLDMREREMLAKPEVSLRAMNVIAEKFGVPLSVIQDISSLLKHNAGEIRNKMHVDIKDIELYVRNNLGGKALYLPTYRRIEKDMISIFPELREKIQSALRYRRVYEPSNQSDLYIELVKFGMDDVKFMIERRIRILQNLALSEVNSFSTRYLQDVIQNRLKLDDMKRIQNFNKHDLEEMFVNIEDSPLNETDRKTLYKFVEKIKLRKDTDIEGHERYLAHCVLSLIDISESINAREKSIWKFVDVCNGYFFNKKFVFNNLNHSLSIKYDDDGRSVEMEELSSGEKQIVSLFAHMALGDDRLNYVIIDEPELSLSVNWQQKLLQDISKFESCAFIGAVTHSPFIFENELDDYAYYMDPSVTKGKA